MSKRTVCGNSHALLFTPWNYLALDGAILQMVKNLIASDMPLSGDSECFLEIGDTKDCSPPRIESCLRALIPRKLRSSLSADSDRASGGGSNPGDLFSDGRANPGRLLSFRSWKHARAELLETRKDLSRLSLIASPIIRSASPLPYNSAVSMWLIPSPNCAAVQPLLVFSHSPRNTKCPHRLLKPHVWSDRTGDVPCFRRF